MSRHLTRDHLAIDTAAENTPRLTLKLLARPLLVRRPRRRCAPRLWRPCGVIFAKGPFRHTAARRLVRVRSKISLRQPKKHAECRGCVNRRILKAKGVGDQNSQRGYLQAARWFMQHSMAEKSAEEDRRCSAWPRTRARLKEPKTGKRHRRQKATNVESGQVGSDVDAALRGAAMRPWIATAVVITVW